MKKISIITGAKPEAGMDLWQKILNARWHEMVLEIKIMVQGAKE